MIADWFAKKLNGWDMSDNQFSILPLFLPSLYKKKPSVNLKDKLENLVQQKMKV